MKYLFRARYQSDDHEGRNIRVCGTAEEAEAYRRSAQKAADEIYDCGDKPACWDRDDWLDEWQTRYSKLHDEEVKRVCAEKGIADHYSKVNFDEKKFNETNLRAAATIGMMCNTWDPLMWYYSGLERPHYFIEEVPG